MSALPIEVRATDPPSQAVEVLGQRVHIGPAHVVHGRWSVVYILGYLIQVEHGAATGSPVPPRIPDEATPLARIWQPHCAAIVQPQHITLLNPDGSTT
jgi:hypothetical protein